MAIVIFFITLTFTYKDGDDKQLEGNRNAGILYAIKNDMERIQQNSDSVYIDSYWLGGDESDVYHYVLGKGECITSELDILFRMREYLKILSIFIIV